MSTPHRGVPGRVVAAALVALGLLAAAGTFWRYGVQHESVSGGRFELVEGRPFVVATFPDPSKARPGLGATVTFAATGATRFSAAVVGREPSGALRLALAVTPDVADPGPASVTLDIPIR